MKKTFVLVCIRDTTLMWHWTITADDELDVARHILPQPWTYENVFWALRINMQRVDAVREEQSLHSIKESWFERRGRAVLYLVPVEPTAPVPTEVRGR